MSIHMYIYIYIQCICPSARDAHALVVCSVLRYKIIIPSRAVVVAAPRVEIIKGD